MHSALSEQHASPSKSMKDDASPALQLFDMQTAPQCKFALTALDKQCRKMVPRPRCAEERRIEAEINKNHLPMTNGCFRKEAQSSPRNQNVQ